jgi:GT2 family glycosyltransferase
MLLESLKAQIYPNWEAVLVDDGSHDPELDSLLAKLGTDKRFEIICRQSNGGISAASNDGLRAAHGPYVAFVDQDDLLTPEALDHVARVLLRYPDTDLVYSDEDKVDERGRRFDHFAKPDYSPHLLLQLMYTCHLSVYRTALVSSLGGLRSSFDGAQDHDLVLRVVERSDRIRHIPRVLYHWRQNRASFPRSLETSGKSLEAGRRAVQAALDRRGIDASVTPAPIGFYVRRVLNSSALVSIVVPIRDKPELLERLIVSMRRYRTYPNHELIIVDNGSKEVRTRELLATLQREHPSARVLRDDGDFNFSRLNNTAVKHAAGEFVLLLNNDTEVIHDDWIEPMLLHALDVHVGAVGAVLLYPNATFQHVGVTVRWPAGPRHRFRGWSATKARNLNHLQAIHLDAEVSAVTAACLMIRKSIYLEIGGMNEKRFAIEYNDVDLCLRVQTHGYKILVTPSTRLLHHESKTRSRHFIPEERAAMQGLWQARWCHDRFLNPNLSSFAENMALAEPWRMPMDGRLPGEI